MKTTALTLITIILCITTYSQSPSTSAESLFEKKTFVYKTVGKTPIHADLFQTPGNTPLKPVIIWIHGGALINCSFVSR